MFRKKNPFKTGAFPPPRTNFGGETLPVSVRSEPLVGFRIWKVKPTPDGLGLWSLNTHYQWDISNQAECLPPPPRMFMGVPVNESAHPEPAPFVGCACGFYVSLPDQPLQEWEHVVYGKVHATGSVLLTGRVLRCSMGFKSEHAEIMSPVVLNVHCSASFACTDEVVSVDLQTDNARGWCKDHVPGVGVCVEAGQYMRHAADQLQTRYEGIEFISWFNL
jgi:hypothetical protein